MFTIATVQATLTNLATFVEIAIVATIALGFLLSLIPPQTEEGLFEVASNKSLPSANVNSHADFVESVKFAFSTENDPVVIEPRRNDEYEYVSDGHEDEDYFDPEEHLSIVDNLNVKELKKLAKAKGLKGYSKKSAVEMRRALRPLMA